MGFSEHKTHNFISIIPPMKITLQFIITLFLTTPVYSQSVMKTMLRLPDTGQDKSFTNTFGEDNDYTNNPPYYINNGNGTITDTVTGLMWQQTDGGEMTIENAEAYCDTLSLGGHSDWRLPTIYEAVSILNFQNVNPPLDTKVFTKTGADYWWTSQKQANDVTRAWETNAGGGIGSHPKDETVSAGGTKKFHCRAVRSIHEPVECLTHFEDQGNGTIQDYLTNLVWLKKISPDSLTWEQAITYAESFSTNGTSDWRLPNIKELQSIEDVRIINPSIDTKIFTNMGNKVFWSSTSLPNIPEKAWYLNTANGITTYDFKTGKHYVVLVRSQNTGTAVEEAQGEPFTVKISPNPASSEISVSFGTTNSISSGFITITNSIGQIMFSGNVAPNTKEFHINTQSFMNGLYMVRINENTTSYVSKFLILK